MVSKPCFLPYLEGKYAENAVYTPQHVSISRRHILQRTALTLLAPQLAASHIGYNCRQNIMTSRSNLKLYSTARAPLTGTTV
jgi:hypothetical protein